MKISLFGGNIGGISIESYLNTLKEKIAVEIETALKINKTEELIKEELNNQYNIEKISFDFFNSYVKEFGPGYCEQQINRTANIGSYYFYIPFSGDLNILQYKPAQPYGLRNNDAEVIQQNDKNYIRTKFNAEKDNQEQINYFKSESIGKYLIDNCREANKQIDLWNKDLCVIINSIYEVTKFNYDKNCSC